MTGRILLPDEPVRSLDAYLARGGGRALEEARSAGPEGTIAAIDVAGLRGRGGAGFPTGRKWASIRGGGPELGDRYVVANGAEGEPGTFKDRALMQRNPWQVIEGLAVAAYAVGAVHAYLAVKESFTPQIESLAPALEALAAAGLLGDVPVTLVAGPEEYLFGEETGLLEVIEGEDPLPRLFPPYLYGLFTTRPQFGWSAGIEARAEVGGQGEPASGSNPTLVNNVETLANVPPILARGADWYRGFGSNESPGVAIVTVVGDVVRPGVAEIELGRPLRGVIEEVAGGVADGRELQAALSGVSNAVLVGQQLDAPLSYEGMAEAGSGLGALGYTVFDDTADMVAVAHAVSRFLWVESCGQCPACKFGTGEVTAYLERLLDGSGTDQDVERIAARLRSVTDANRCYLGREEQVVIGSLLQAFPEQFVEYLEGRAHRRRDVTVPKLVDLADGTVVIDHRQARKRPDWTYE